MTAYMIPPGGHQLPPLPYAYNALEPVISAETMRYHYGLHKKAVECLNNTELKLAEARKKNKFDEIKYWENQLAYCGSGHILHSIYWTIMTPVGTGGQPGYHTLNLINAYFGSFPAFQRQFTEAADNVEGSGWAVLTWQPTWRHLEILQAGKHQNLTQWSGIPVLVADVWEHAYYLDYKSNRSEYVDAWWRLVNWYEVEKRLILALNGQVPMSIS